MTTNTILEKMLNENVEKRIKIIFTNGFQMWGKLLAYDSSHMLLETDAYGPNKTVAVPHSSVSAYVPNA